MASNKKVLKNASAQILGKFITVSIAFIVVKILSAFGKEFYGNYLTTYEYLAFFGILADAGLFAIAVREISKFEGQNKEKPISQKETPEFIIGNILSMRLILIFLATLIAGVSAQFIDKYPDIVKTGIWITGLSMALTMIAGSVSAILQARMKIHFFSGSLVFGKVLLMGLIVAISHFWGNVKTETELFFAFLWAGLFSNFVFCSLVCFFGMREISIRPKFDFDWWKKVFKISLPYGISLILQTLYLRIDLILISIILGAEAIGVYGIAARILESALVIGVFFGQSMLPKISAEEHSHEKSSKTLAWGAEKLIIFALPICIGAYFFAPEIITLLSSQEFLSSPNFFGADKVLVILIPTILFAYFNQLFSFSLVSKNKQNYLLFVNATAVIFNVGLNLLFLKQYGIAAAAWSTLFCEAVVFGLLVWEVRKYFSFLFSKLNFSLIIGINILIFSLIFLTPLRQNLILSVAFSSLVYLGFLWTFRRRLLVSTR